MTSILPVDPVARGLASIISRLLKRALFAPTVDNSPAVTRVFRETDTGQVNAITDQGTCRPILWVKDPHMLDIEGALPGTSAKDLEDRRRHLALIAEPLMGDPSIASPSPQNHVRASNLVEANHAA